MNEWEDDYCNSHDEELSILLEEADWLEDFDFEEDVY